MVSTRGAATAAGAGPTQGRLTFKDKLSGASSNDVLLKKLKSLYDELAKLEQGNVDVQSLNAVRRELIASSILLHKDKGVKAYAACCLADLLRLYAPDAPYTAAELRDMFQFFFQQLGHNFKHDSPYFHQYFLLIESLSTVKSIVLICDIPGSEELMAMLFREFFKLAKPGDLGRNVEIYMADILAAVIDEAPGIPNDVVQVIINQFLPNTSASSHRIASSVCNTTSDKLQRYVCQYFTDIMISAIDHDEDDEDAPQGQQHDTAAIKSAHTLIHSMSLSAPGLLHNVIPQLEAELRTEDPHLRSLATKTLGDIFSNPRTGTELIKKYGGCWKTWSSRKIDKSPSVRVAWLESTKGFMDATSEVKAEVEEGVNIKLYDPDEKVRAASCRIYGQMTYETLLQHVSLKQLRAVAERTLDKKATVREEAMAALSRLWSLAWPDIASNNKTVIERVSWIPNIILHGITHSMEAKHSTEELAFQYIFPLPSKEHSDDDIAWTERLLKTWKYLDSKAMNNLLSMTPLRSVYPSLYDHLIQSCVENNGGTIDKDEEVIKRKLSIVVTRVAGFFPDPQRAAEDLYNFAKLNDQRIYKLMKSCMDPSVDLKTVCKLSSELVQRLEKAQASIVGTITAIWRRAAFWIINTSTIRVLLRVMRGQVNGLPEEAISAAEYILNYVAKNRPAMLESYSPEFVKILAEEQRGADAVDDDDDDDVDGAGSGSASALSEIALRALGGLARLHNDGELSEKNKLTRQPTPSEIRAQKLAKEIVVKGTPGQTKFAARILAYSKQRKEVCVDVIESIADRLDVLGSHEEILACVISLAEFSKVVPDAFETKSEVLMEFLLKSVLLQPVAASNEMNIDWIDDASLTPFLRAKMQAIKVCRNRCITHAGKPTAQEVSAPVLKMFFRLLDQQGSLKDGDEEPPAVKTRLRLLVANSLLHLSSFTDYRTPICQKFIDLALVIQDTCFEVRFGFLQKLVARLQQHVLDPMFNVILFMTVLDPERETRERARNYVQFAQKRSTPEVKTLHLEMIFIRLLHLIAHHPDFDGNDVESMKELTQYITFYLDLIATADNLPLLFHLALKAKTVRDAEAHGYSENLYITSEIAQEMIKARAKIHNWGLPVHPGKVRLPGDIFKPLPDSATAGKILAKTYLPDELAEWLIAEGGKPLKSPGKNKEKAAKASAKEAATSDDEMDTDPAPQPNRRRRGRPPKVKRGPGRPRKRPASASQSEDEGGGSAEDEASEDEEVTPNRKRAKKEKSPTPEVIESSEDDRGSDIVGMSKRTRAKARKASSKANGKQ